MNHIFYMKRCIELATKAIQYAGFLFKLTVDQQPEIQDKKQTFAGTYPVLKQNLHEIAIN